MKSSLRIGRIVRPVALASLFLVLSTFTFTSRTAASQESPAKSAQAVLEEYRRMDARGDRLTGNGWREGAKFFLAPAPPPPHKAIFVMFGEEIYEVSVNGNNAFASIRTSALGQIDDSARFTTVVFPELIDRAGCVLKQPDMPVVHGLTVLDRVYELIITNTHRGFEPGDWNRRQVRGAAEWRIEGFEFEPWVTFEVAIRYLSGLRDTSSSETIKRNAANSISALRRLDDRKSH